MEQHQLNYPTRLQGTALTGSNYQNYNINSQKPLRHRVITTLMVGTFGLVNPLALNATSNWNISTGLKLQTENGVSKNSSIQELEFIRTATRVSVTELARILGVSRQAIHDWQNGSTISDRNKEAIRNFSNIISSFVKAGLEPSMQDFRRKVNGISILDTLHSQAESAEFAKILVATLARENSQRTMLAERFKNRPKPQLSNEDYGAPHLADEA